MSLEGLLRIRVIERIPIDGDLVRRAFELATRDIKTAKDNFNDSNFDWAYAIAYNAMLQAGRGLMFSKGFRPAGAYGHVAVIKFLHEFFSKKFPEKAMFLLHKYRKKRHRIVYEQTELISSGEAESAVKVAEDFVNIARGLL